MADQPGVRRQNRLLVGSGKCFEAAVAQHQFAVRHSTLGSALRRSPVLEGASRAALGWSCRVAAGIDSGFRTVVVVDRIALGRSQKEPSPPILFRSRGWHLRGGDGGQRDSYISSQIRGTEPDTRAG